MTIANEMADNLYPRCPRCGQASEDADFGLRCMAVKCAFESPGFLNKTDAIAWWQRQSYTKETGAWTCGQCHGAHDADVRICTTLAPNETEDEFICGACARGDQDEVPVHSAECDKCELCIGCCPHTDYDRDSQCGNCETIWTADELNEAKDLNQRLMPGDEVPSGECPDCGALCYLVSQIDEDTLTSDQVYESLEAAIDCENEDVRRSISREYKKQIRMRYETDNDPAVYGNLLEPLTLPAEYIFTPGQKAELTAFVKGIIEGMMEFRYGDSAASINHWFQFGLIGDVHICDSEDEETIQAWAYPLKFDKNGHTTGTDTSRSIRLNLDENSSLGANQRSEYKKR